MGIRYRRKAQRLTREEKEAAMPSFLSPPHLSPPEDTGRGGEDTGQVSCPVSGVPTVYGHTTLNAPDLVCCSYHPKQISSFKCNRGRASKDPGVTVQLNSITAAFTYQRLYDNERRERPLSSPCERHRRSPHGALRDAECALVRARPLKETNSKDHASVIVTNNKLPASGACSRKCRCSQPARRLRGAGALAAQALRARGPSGVSVAPSVASGGGVPTDDERATGLQREVMLAARKGLDPYNMLAPKAAASGTQEDPNLVPSITSKRRAGCICDEANSAVIWVRLHKGEAQRGPSSGTHYKLVPHQLAH
ncbi:uncharacterized protein [Kogia breviceps]|uniref:uncharacterized protein n=1 Tax=Kogia breviceps TaxID=27615 RepID=UPI0034D33B90